MVTQWTHYEKNSSQKSIFQREYGKTIDLNLNESSMDKGIVPEYSELLNVDENKSNSSSILNNNSNSLNNNNNSKNPAPFGGVEISPVQISTKPAVILQSITPVKRIEKQIETRRADGKRRITPMFTPITVEQDK